MGLAGDVQIAGRRSLAWTYGDFAFRPETGTGTENLEKSPDLSDPY
jgi:hypothetical protein